MNLFDHIMNDNRSGSGTLLRQIQEELSDLGEREEVIVKEKLFGALNMLTAQFPQFGLLWHFARAFHDHFKTAEKISGERLRMFVATYSDKWKEAQDNASKNMRKEIDFRSQNVLLHSNSSAIHNLFRQLAAGQRFPVVWQTYSSPAGEGLVQAEIIERLGFETHLIHEDALSNFMDKIDLAVFGADMILEDRFLNKTGTFPLSLLCREFHKPVYVLAEQRKRISRPDLFPEQLKLPEKEKPAEELGVKTGTALKVHNLYFEFTPLSLVKNVFLDN